MKNRSEQLSENPYLLLTPGPLSTSREVKSTMLRDWCTWDDDYNSIVEDIRERLVRLAGVTPTTHSAVLIQGSGTFAVESVLTSAVPESGKLLVLENGAYGRRMATIARQAGIPLEIQENDELKVLDLEGLERRLLADATITHVAVVHCETTTGMLNPVNEIGEMVKGLDRIFIVDAMSSFGGIPMEQWRIGADFLISSANKCIQGVPGFGFVIGALEELHHCDGVARSHSLDLYDQWRVMEDNGGKWRFTSPTHVVRAFAQALNEHEQEGGVTARHQRYSTNQRMLVEGMRELGFMPLLPDRLQSPIITSFHYPEHPDFTFTKFYQRLKDQGFVIYPGKVTDYNSFRIGTIGEVYPEDVKNLLRAVAASRYWQDHSTNHTTGTIA